MKKLFLIDAYALIYRAYYALIRAPRVTSYGLNTSAIFGFCNTLHEVLTKENPTHIAVCFDPPHGRTFRHEVYPEYKANRDAQPEDITASIPWIKDIISAYRIPVIEVAGYEADDVIGTLACEAERQGFTTYMMTLDKDYGQLVSDHIFQYRPALRGEGFEIRTPREVCAKYGIERPSQVIDILALEGDKSDNVPGCPGIGEKGAEKLVGEYGSVESIIENVDNLTPANRRKVSENAEMILFSKMLVTIKTDVPVDFDAEALSRKDVDINRLTELFTKLEFRTFLKRLLPADAEPPVPKSTTPQPDSASTSPDGMGSLFDMAPEGDTPSALQCAPIGDADYAIASEPEEISKFIKDALATDDGSAGVALALDSESAMTARCIGIAVATADGSARFIPLDNDAQLQAVKPLFEQPAATIVGHDIKTAMIVLRRAGIAFRAPYFDTSVAHYLLEPEMKHSLAMMATKYLGIAMSDAAATLLTPKGMKTASAASFRAYCEIADLSRRLRPVMTSQLEGMELLRLLTDIELPLIRVLADMEYVGVRIDPRELKRLSDALTERLHALEAQAYEIAGMTFNVSSPMQVGEVLFERLKIDPKAKRTKRGAYSTTEEILEKYRADHPIAGLILDIRALRKLLATYINALPQLINPVTGKIHTSYNQTVTATGRISSTNPNLQNIPIRTEDGAAIRRAFIPDPGNVMMSADYSQIELRLIADLSGDASMIEAFNSGADIHRATAAKIYHEALEDVTDTQRRNAKTANFGIIYGISAFGLSERLGIPRAEAKELIQGYFRSYPGIQQYMDDSIEAARRDLYVKTLKGRRRMLPDINSRNAVVRGYAERNAINAPIQGSAADIIKIAMNSIYAEMKRRGMRSQMIMQVHDELVFNVVPDELAALQELVIREMEHAYSGRVALEVSAGVGANWLEAH